LGQISLIQRRMGEPELRGAPSRTSLLGAPGQLAQQRPLAGPIPVMADQPFWADRLQRLGVAPPPVPFAQLTAAGLAAAITSAISERSYRQRARQVAGLIAADDGATNVIERVRRLAN
jgi:sterol 3beta-glucosyltransferase